MEVRCRSQCDNISYTQLLIPQSVSGAKLFLKFRPVKGRRPEFVSVVLSGSALRAYRATITLPRATRVPCVPSAV